MTLKHDSLGGRVNVKKQPKVMLLAFDGLDWDCIQLYCDHGHLPNFLMLFEESAAGRITAPIQSSSALVWTTAMSGVNEETHGILDDLDYGPGGVSGQVVSKLRLRVPRVWEYADTQGLVSHVLGWPATCPAKIDHGIVVANGIQYQDAGVKDVWPLHPESVFPDTWRDVVLDYRIMSDDIPQASVDDLLKFTNHTFAEKIKVPSTLLLAQILSLHSLGLQMVDEGNAQFFAFRFDTLPFVYGLPFQISFDESPINHFLGWYKLIDAMLGKYMSTLTDADYLMVISERGMPQVLTGKPDSIFVQQGDGVVFIKGPDINKDTVIPVVTLLDISPTLLTMLGLRAHEKLLGKSLFNSAETLSPIEVPYAWPKADMGLSDVLPSQKNMSSESLLAQDVDLLTADFSGLYKIRDQVCVQQLFALAHAYRQKGNLRAAKEALQALICIEPNHVPALIMLSRTLLELNALDESRSLVEQYQYLKNGPIWTNLIDGMLALGSHHYEQAAICFERLLNYEKVPVNIHLWYADALIKLNKYQDAKTQLEKAVKLGTEVLQAWQKLSFVQMQLGQLDEALLACNQAIAMQPANPDLLINRFEIKTYLGQSGSARQDLLRALKIKPDIISQDTLNRIILKQPKQGTLEIYSLKKLIES
jgi:tetratricopeptide (TPR) repeat protein